MKKKVAIYYENGLGRNDGFPLYAYNLLKDKELYPDLDAVHLIPDGNYKGHEDLDLNIWIDWGEDGLTNHLPYELVWPTNAPLVYFASDTHLGKEYRFETAKKADYVFFAQKGDREEYEQKHRTKKNKHVGWMPWGVEPRAFPDTPKAAKKYDVCFVGHLVLQDRIDFLDAIFKEFPNFWFGKRLSRYVLDQGQVDDCADIFRKSKIVLNPPTKNDFNMRHAEAAATGSFQLTQAVPGLYDVFTEGESVVTYQDIPDAIEKIRYYLEHEAEREAIAAKAKEIVLGSYTYKHNVDTMLRVAGLIDGQGARQPQ